MTSERSNESTPLIGGNKKDSAQCPHWFGCYVEKAFCCVPLGGGLFVVMGLDFSAFVVLLVSFCLTTKYGADAHAGAMALANAIFFIVVALVLLAAVFIKARTWANIFVWACMILRCFLVLFLLVGWCWSVANWADCGGTFGCPDSIKVGHAMGFFCSIIMWIIEVHCIQIINSWRIKSVGGRPLSQIFQTASDGASSPKLVKDASGVRRPYNETGDAVNPAGDIEDPVPSKDPSSSRISGKSDSKKSIKSSK